MPQILLTCVRVSLIAAAIACFFGSPHQSVAVEPAPAKQMVEVKIRVIAVSISKLRTLGFDWDSMRSGRKAQRPVDIANEEDFNSFVQALEENNLVRTLAKPMIATRSGQKAVIDISPHLKLEVTPTVSDAEHIDFAYHIDVAADRDVGRFVSGSSTELKSGASQLLSETTIQRRTAKGEPSQSTVVVFAQATIIK